MKRWVALLRGINVGGRNSIAMADLRGCFEAAGASSVRTYIQSGNVVFDCARGAQTALVQAVVDAIGVSHGFEPGIQLIAVDDLEAAARNNPFPAAAEVPTSLHLFFSSGPLSRAGAGRAGVDAALEELRAASEAYALVGDVLYLHAPEGVARSKLARRAESVLGVPLTARNWRTVTRLLELASSPR
jgi:uncharacterized protein (DUF1697 family)